MIFHVSLCIYITQVFFGHSSLPSFFYTLIYIYLLKSPVLAAAPDIIYNSAFHKYITQSPVFLLYIIKSPCYLISPFLQFISTYANFYLLFTTARCIVPLLPTAFHFICCILFFSFFNKITCPRCSSRQYYLLSIPKFLLRVLHYFSYDIHKQLPTFIYTMYSSIYHIPLFKFYKGFYNYYQHGPYY